MSIHTIGIMSPGDMGHAVGQLLREHELQVATCLAGRSERTRALSEKAGIQDLPSMEELVSGSDVILSITVPEAALALCKQVADAVQATKADLLYVELNAVAPKKALQMESIMTAAGGRFSDGSIIGAPPKNGSSPRFYASGPHSAEVEELKEFGLDVRLIGPETGRASGLKMAYGALTKGSAALYVQLMMAAELMGLTVEISEEFEANQPAFHRSGSNSAKRVPTAARRYVSEMEEIKDTFVDLGLGPDLFQGVGDMYRFIGDTPLGAETPENHDDSRTAEETIRTLADYLKRGAL